MQIYTPDVIQEFREVRQEVTYIPEELRFGRLTIQTLRVRFKICQRQK